MFEKLTFQASPAFGKNLTSVNVSPISGYLNGLKKEASRRECNVKKNLFALCCMIQIVLL